MRGHVDIHSWSIGQAVLVPPGHSRAIGRHGHELSAFEWPDCVRMVNRWLTAGIVELLQRAEAPGTARRD
ncbi:hypothetical protein ASE63_10775 [Bosea sp. Root381]|nr:hypothetical protein ASE63_10775 [Bosea sp. Root381]